MPPTFTKSFKLSSEGNTYTNFKQKFKEHFKGKVALVFERTQFVQCLQQEREDVMAFIEDLQKRADICSFGDLRDQMVHTQIVASSLYCFKLSGRHPQIQDGGQ